ncbi:MAG: PAN domain-containing protein [Pseudomonadota bacterium]
MDRTSRPLLTVAAAVAAFTCVGTASAQGENSAEVDTYRFGGTFARIAASTPAVCAALCVEDNRCEAWSHSPPMIDARPQCELKRTQGRAENRPGFTSGIAGFHQVGALRQELGATLQAERRNTTRVGMRARMNVFSDGYTPVSTGIEVDALLGASAQRNLSQRAPTQTRNAAPSNSFAPKRVSIARALTGKYSGPLDGSYSDDASTNDYSRSRSSSNGQTSYATGGGGQVILAQESSTRDSSFYEDD